MISLQNVNFTDNITNGSHNAEFGFIALFSLGIVSIAIQIISGGLVIVTYSLFKELRTLYSILLVNLIIVVLLIALASLGVLIPTSIPQLCQTTAIVTHYLLLVRCFSLSILMFEAITHFYQVLKVKPPSTKEVINKKNLTLYLSLCWGVPALIVVVFVIVNYTVEDSIQYGGTDGRCSLYGTVALMVGFLVPLVISVAFNISGGVFIVYVLGKIGYKKFKTQASLDVRKKSLLRDVRVVLAVFFITGTSWTIGAISLITMGELVWTEYMYVILEALQMVLIAVVYLCTRRIFQLYWNLLRCKYLQTHSKPHDLNGVAA
jgi:hypothetical protein